MEELKNKQDFEWYKTKLDANAKYRHKHHGEPEKYPCKILKSEFWDNPNGPFEYYHFFIYQQEVVCERCRNKSIVWPKIEE